MFRTHELRPGWVPRYFNGRRVYNTSFHSYVGTNQPAGNMNAVGMATDLWSASTRSDGRAVFQFRYVRGATWTNAAKLEA
jgi:hypothetical protein